MFRNLAEDATIEIYFETFNASGVPTAPSSAFVASDFAIYKNGSATAKATTNGLTVTSPFNSEPGCHLLIADTSNDTGDAGFWATGARYQVKFNTAKTVDSKSIDGRSVPRGSFGIQSEYMRGTDSAALASGVNVTQFGGTNITAAAGIPEVKVASIANNAITAASIADNAIDTATFAAGATLPRVTLVDTCSVNSDMRGTDGAYTGTPPSASTISAQVAADLQAAHGSGSWTTATGFATPTNVTDAVTSIKGTDNDTLKTLSDQIDGIEGGGGGGDATLAKQNEILAAVQGSAVIQVASPNVSGNLVLTQGDDYDGVANPRAQWTVTTDYTSGWTVRLTIRDSADAVVYTNTGSVVSATVVAVTIAAPTSLTMTGCPGQWQGKFDVELTHSSGKKKTIALGTCYINEDQTR
jgi:hypothetical protein